jgi:hypothetical protein
MEAVVKLRDLRKKADVSDDVRYGTHQSREKKKKERRRCAWCLLGLGRTRPCVALLLASLDGYSTSWPVFFSSSSFPFADFFEIILGLQFDSNEFLLICKIINISQQVISKKIS